VTVFDYIFGLPMHALVIHAVVVFVPLTSLAAIGYAVRPGWRRVLRWPVVVGAVVSGVSAYVATESGEQLLRRVSAARAGTTDFALLAEHQEWGDRARTVCFVFMLVALALVWFVRPPGDRSPGGRSLGTVLSVLGVVSAVAATVTVVLAGHAGSAAVWHGLG
jgi:hypothetical protein